MKAYPCELQSERHSPRGRVLRNISFQPCYSRSTFTTLNCMPLKLNYFIHTEQRNISQNHSYRYLEIIKKYLGVLKAVE